jgi:hypothetical protein
VGAGAESGAVQKPQNANPSGFSFPQAGHVATARVYDCTRVESFNPVDQFCDDPGMTIHLPHPAVRRLA